MLYTKIQPQSFLGSEDDFFLPYMAWWPSDLMDYDPFDRWLHMKFQENWPRGFREESQGCGQMDNGLEVITIAYPEPSAQVC